MNAEADPPKKTMRRPVIGIGIVFLLAAAVVVAWQYNARQNTWGTIHFQEFAPSYLPDKLAISSKSIDARYAPANEPARTTILDLKLSSHSFIYEQKASKPFLYSCGKPIMHTSCNTGNSAHGQRFLLTTTTVPGQPIQQLAEWSQGGTNIQLNFYGESSQPYSPAMIGKVIDSFQPVQYTDLHVNYYDNSKI
jgi:hypothetical protein